MKFKLVFSMDNDSFSPGLGDPFSTTEHVCASEIVSVIQNSVIKTLEEYGEDGVEEGTAYKIRDSNGNTIGHWEISK